MKKQISRRDFLKLAGGAVVTAAGVGMLPQFLRKTLSPEQVVQAAVGDPDLFFAGTDGWMYLPGTVPGFQPDSYAVQDHPPFTTYIFGFRNLTGLNPVTQSDIVAGQKNHAQHNAPLFWVDQETEFKLLLTNLGLAQRPDLTDSHTLHWHGFRNVIPFFDGEPTGSISVPVGRYFTYVYKPHDPGTYMYHCHVEDVEHVHMGMTGIVFVRAAQNKTGNGAGAPIARAGGGAASAPLGYAYNDGVSLSDPTSTAYDREFPMFLSEVWSEAHWNDAHIQDTDWSRYKADYSLLNGRVYPDTLAPNGGPTDLTTGEKIAPAGRPDLQYNPHSSLVECNSGEKVLLRFANLGFREAAMTFAGLTVRVVGRDATPMRGFGPDGVTRNGVDTSYETDTLLIGAGEGYDVIFTAPAPGTYVLYNRRYTQDDDQSTQGQRTEIRVYAAGTIAQQNSNDGYGI
jgi:FtsP/CotA-like multicopper oxidase with cupredoxin domain